MANRKITDLTALAAGSQATGDLLPIVDVSESAAVDKNKKITVENLFKGIPGSVGIGTSSPQSELTVRGNTPQITLEPTADTQTCRLQFCTTNGALQSTIQSGGSLGPAIKVVNATTSTETFRFTAAGQLGIGTTSPGRILEIKANTPIIRITDADAGGGQNVRSEIGANNGNLSFNADQASSGTGGVFTFVSAGSEKMRLKTNGNLGLGTDNPATLLHLQSSEPKLQLQDSDGTNQFSLLRQSTNALYYDGRNGSGAGNHLWRLWNGSAFIEKMRLASNGSFGIGTSNPTSKLHVKVDGTSQTIQTWQNDLGTNDRTINLKGPTTDSATEPFTFQTGNSIAFEIDTTERLKIGAAGDITANSTQLYFGETNSTTNEINIGNGRTTNGYAVIDLIGDATYATYGLRVIRQNTGANANSDIAHRGTGNLSLNAIDAGQVVLSQNNTARLFLRSTDGKVILTGSAGARSGTGTVITSTNDSCGSVIRATGYLEWQTDAGAVGTTYFASDQTLKENIVNASATASGVINSISFKEFDWKAEAGRTDHVDIGVVAQQVAEVEPGLTMTLSDGKMSINEPAFMTYTAKALQEALAEIETLKAKVAALEAQ